MKCDIYVHNVIANVCVPYACLTEITNQLKERLQKYEIQYKSSKKLKFRRLDYISTAKKLKGAMNSDL